MYFHVWLLCFLFLLYRLFSYYKACLLSIHHNFSKRFDRVVCWKLQQCINEFFLFSFAEYTVQCSFRSHECLYAMDDGSCARCLVYYCALAYMYILRSCVIFFLFFHFHLLFRVHRPTHRLPL